MHITLHKLHFIMLTFMQAICIHDRGLSPRYPRVVKGGLSPPHITLQGI
jgi:hypothetical protein